MRFADDRIARIQTPKLTEYQADHAAAVRYAGDLFKALRERIDADFSGCRRFNGRGWVVTWDTMDCMDRSCATFGGCPEESCTAETREASGLNAGIYQKHDRIRGLSFDVLDYAKPEEVAEIAAAKACVTAIADSVDYERRRAEIEKGDEVKVVRCRQRKAPVGTTGRVFWIGENGYGPGYRVGIETPAGERVFTNADNLDFEGEKRCK